MTPEKEQAIIKHMTENGWTCDINTADKLGFILKVNDEFEWIRDYDKKTMRFVQFNGKKKVNLVVKK